MEFFKYQGTGNDFILIDNRTNDNRKSESRSFLSREQIAKLCDRRFGIGGDGLILLNSHPEFDFEMKNYNSDGGECSMCGNGARTLVQFAFDLGLKKDRYHFLASDGIHEATLERDSASGQSEVAVKMRDVSEITSTPLGTLLNTGSPHLIVPTREVMTYDVVTEGRRLRNSPMFMPAGVNVNFVETYSGHAFVRTYERGVEDETLSCGTGVIAAALMFPGLAEGAHEIAIETRGGRLKVRFEKKSGTNFLDIWLVGPAKYVFSGNTEV